MLAAAFRKYGKTAVMQASGHFGENWLFLVHYLLRVLRVVVMLSVWRVILAGKGPVSGMTMGAVLTYTLIAEVFADPLSGRTSMPHDLWDGRIAVRLLRPMPVFGQYIAEAVGGWGINFCLFSVPLFILAPFLGANPLPHSPAMGAWFILSLILAAAVGFAIDFIFASLVVSLGNGDYSVNQLRIALTVLLTGQVLPLALLPWGIGDIFAWLPFASQASAPLRIYTGTGDPIRLVCIQMMWAVILWPCVCRIWRVQRERLVTYGG